MWKVGWKTPRGEKTTLICFPHSYKFTRSHRSFISFQTFPSFCQPQDPEQLQEGSLLRPRGRIKPKSSILGTIGLANRPVHLFPASLSQSKGVFGRIAQSMLHLVWATWPMRRENILLETERTDQVLYGRSILMRKSLPFPQGRGSKCQHHPVPN